MPGKRDFLFAGVLFLVLALAGCAYHLALGVIPQGDPQALIKTGVTTQSEVKAYFGPPDLSGQDEDGRPTWTYTRIAVELKGGASKMTELFRLTVAFEGQVVKTFSFDRKIKEGT